MSGELSRVNVGYESTTRDFFYRSGTTDEGVISQIFKRGDYELRKLPCYKAIGEALRDFDEMGVRPLVIDAGANIGAASVFFNLMLPKSRIAAIEPEERNFEVLCRNMEGLDADCIRGALASSPGRATLSDPDRGSWAFRTERATGQDASVPCVTIDEIYVRELSEEVKPFIVKIDIEGFEKDVFSANTDWVDQTPILIVEIHDWLLPGARTSQTFLQCVAGKDRGFHFIGENIYSIGYRES